MTELANIDPIVYNFKLPIGADYLFSIDVSLDLTGYTAQFIVTNNNQKTVEEMTLTPLTATSARLEYNIPHAFSETLMTNVYPTYKLKLISPGNIHKFLMTGQMEPYDC